MTEVYSKSADFPNGLASGQLVSEIEADPSITTTLLTINTSGDVVDIVFQSTISAPEKSALDVDVANHIPLPTNSIDTVPGYIELNSTLADSSSIILNASNVAGGIDIYAGSGGIAIDTTNAISLDAAAASNFTTSVGNLELRATTGLVNIDGGSGINIGSLTETQPINIGTSASARTITIGNQTGVSQNNIRAGTGGFNVDVASGGGISLDSTGANSNWTLASTGAGQDLTIALTGSNDSSIIIDSQGTGSDSIRFNTAGGIDADATGIINFATGSSAGGAITLDSAFNNGGITLSSGTQGIAINSNGGLIGIGHWSGGNMSIGTAAVTRTISLGNTTGATSVNINTGTGGMGITTTGTGDFIVSSGDTIQLDATNALEINSSGGIISIGNDAISQNINLGTAGARIISIGNATSTTAVSISSGTFGITIGNNENGGEIQIGKTSSTAKTITLGNNNGSTRLFTRWGTGGNINTQLTPTTLPNSNTTLTMGQLVKDILLMTPTVDRTLTLPTASNIVSSISGAQVNDSFDFRITNLATGASDPTIILATGTGGNSVGYMNIDPHVNNAGTYVYSGTGIFRIRLTNVTASSETYIVYRIG